MAGKVATELLAHAFADIFPLMAAAEYDALKSDIGVGCQSLKWFGINRARPAFCEITTWTPDPKYLFVTHIVGGVAEGTRRPILYSFIGVVFEALGVEPHRFLWRLSREQLAVTENGWMREGKRQIPPGFLYVIEAVGTPFVKVGWSDNPDWRLASLQCGCPYELRLLATIPAKRPDEAKFFKTIAGMHHRGEWYLNDGILDSLLAFGARNGD